MYVSLSHIPDNESLVLMACHAGNPNYMMDEDSNRMLVESLEDDWVKQNRLSRVGEEAWRRYVSTITQVLFFQWLSSHFLFPLHLLVISFLRRNRSIMTEVAMVQVLNTVTCPECNFSSRNFDPFNLLSVPFPSVADIIFQCHVLRRADAFNTPWVLNKSRKGNKGRVRFSRRSSSKIASSPPANGFIVEEYTLLPCQDLRTIPT